MTLTSVALSMLLAACGSATPTAAPKPTEAPKPTAVPPTAARCTGVSASPRPWTSPRPLQPSRRVRPPCGASPAWRFGSMASAYRRAWTGSGTRIMMTSASAAAPVAALGRTRSAVQAKNQGRHEDDGPAHDSLYLVGLHHRGLLVVVSGDDLGHRHRVLRRDLFAGNAVAQGGGDRYRLRHVPAGSLDARRQ